jgi:hypothetical protein
VLKHLSLLLLFSIGLIAFNGCARKIVLHPLTDKDIKQDGNWICMTPEYVQEVMRARLGK